MAGRAAPYSQERASQSCRASLSAMIEGGSMKALGNGLLIAVVLGIAGCDPAPPPDQNLGRVKSGAGSIPEAEQRWVDESCSRSLGPALWRSCVERETGALQRPGWPSLDRLSQQDQQWISQSCSRSLGPALWRSCVERETGALQRPGWPSLDRLSQQDQQWISQSCSRSLGPALWRSCVEREMGALSPSGRR